jgi:hypothetical protein
MMKGQSADNSPTNCPSAHTWHLLIRPHLNFFPLPHGQGSLRPESGTARQLGNESGGNGGGQTL